jgi:serine/threonine protein kinase
MLGGSKTILWAGETAHTQFELNVHLHCQKGEYPIKARVCQGCTVAEIDFVVSVSADKVEGLGHGKGLVRAPSVVKLLSPFKTQLAFADITELAQPFASGNFGSVARCKYKGVDVVVKTVKNVEDLQAFDREVCLQTLLGMHPHVVQIVAANCDPALGSLCIVMEGMDCSLEDKLSEPSTRAQRVAWLSDIASGMANLACENVVHRDIASRNCLFAKPLVGLGGENGTKASTVKIADFGLASSLEDGQIKFEAGTQIPVAWTAPEVRKPPYISSKPSDVYMFGCTMLELCIPLPPCLNDRFDRLRSRDTSGLKSDPVLEEIARECLSVSPLDRPTIQSLLPRLYSELKAVGGM